MLKKLSLRRFSLQKQVALIFSVLAVLVVAILIPLIDNNLAKVIDKEMYDVLDNAQRNYIAYGNQQMFLREEKKIVHIKYDEQIDILSKSTYDVFYYDLLEMINTNTDTLQSTTKEYDGQTIYYQIKKPEGSTKYYISMMYSDYSNTLVDSFRSEVIYIFYIALAIVAILLYIWVTTLIKPLKLIHSYIDAIKDDKESTLSIDRDDEIGVVSRGLVDMKVELDKQGKIKEEMIHNISHDLKTPIALIKTYSQSIKDDVYPYGDKDSSMDVIIENAERLEKKVKSLLYLNRLDYISGENNQENVDMKELIEHIVIQFKAMHPNIEIVLNLDYIDFRGNQEYWRICVENILENAYRYVESKIEITLHDDYLEIYNDGDAIDDDCIDSLFQPYEKGTKGQFGLGLSIVYKTVTMYEYTVEAKNATKGVKFIIKGRNALL